MVVVVSSFVALLVFAFGLGLGATSNTKTHTGSEAVRESQRTNRNEGDDSMRRPAAGPNKGGPGEAARTGGSSTGRGEGRIQCRKEGHRKNTRNIV